MAKRTYLCDVCGGELVKMHDGTWDCPSCIDNEIDATTPEVAIYE